MVNAFRESNITPSENIPIMKSNIIEYFEFKNMIKIINELRR